MAKTHDKKDDFIRIISMMSDTELNNYIKAHGPSPKPFEILTVVDKKKDNK